jgi:hypothetical protein
MGRTDNWGNEPLTRAKHLIRFLLSYDNSERDKLSVQNWRKKDSNRPEMDIQTKLSNLALLLNKDSIKSKYDSQLNKKKEELQSTIDRLKSLEIVRENSTRSDKSKGIRSFTFILWHSSKVEENLTQLELAWRNYPKSKKSKAEPALLPSDIQTSEARKKELDSELKTIIKTYLSKSFSADKFAELDQAGEPETGSEGRTQLKQVFIDLDVQYYERLNPRDMKLEQVSLFARSISSDDDDDDDLSWEKNKPFSAIKCLLNEKLTKIVIIGGPGQGKSTLGQQIAQLYRAKLLDKPYDFGDKVRVKRIPFRVVLKYFAQWFANKKTDNNSLEVYLAEEIGKVSLRNNISAQNIQDIFLDQECLLILDGLDEVVDSKLQEQMLERIYSFLEWAEHLQVNLKVVATSRPNIYKGQFEPKDFYHFELLPLSSNKVQEYAKKWVKTRDLREEEQNRIYSTLRECQRDERISSLLQTPLQVTIILLIIKNGGRPPGEREALFNEYWQTILKREKSKDKDIIKSDDTTLLNLHAYLGYLLHCRASNNNVKALLSEEELKQAIIKFLRKRDSRSLDKDINLRVEQFVRDAKDRLVLIVSPQPELFGFELRSFQEYFAAVYLFKTGERYENLKFIVCSEHWSYVALFLAGRIARELGDDADGILRNVCRAVDRPVNDEDENRYLRPGAWFALEVSADGSLSKNYRDLQYEAIEYGLEVLETGLTEGQQRKLWFLTEQLSEKDQRDLLRPSLEAKLCSKDLPETCWEVVLNLYGRHFGATQFFQDKIDVLFETQKKNLVLCALKLALLYESEPLWMVERLQRHWSFWINDIPYTFFHSFKYFENLLNMWSLSNAEATEIAETIGKKFLGYIEMYSHQKIEWDMPQPKTLSEQLILMLRCLWFTCNSRKEILNHVDILIEDHYTILKAVLYGRTKLNHKLILRSVSDKLVKDIDALLRRADLMPWLRGVLWVIYWLINQPSQTKVITFLNEMNLNDQTYELLRKLWFSSPLKKVWPLLTLAIERQKTELQNTVDQLLPFLDASTQISVYEQIIEKIREYFQQSEVAQKQQLIIALQTQIGLDELLPELVTLAESMGLTVEDLVGAHIIVPSYVFSDIPQSINCDNDQLSKLLTIAYNLIKQGKTPVQSLWSLIDNSCVFDAVVVKQVLQILELILENYSESSEYSIASISVALFIKLLACDTQVEEIASCLFTTLPLVKILEIRIPGSFLQACVRYNPKFLQIMQSLLTHKEEAVRVGIALVFKVIVDLKTPRYPRKYISQEFKNIRIDFSLGMSFINHENSKHRVVGTKLLTLCDYPVEDIKYQNLILENLKQPQTDEEKEAWYQFLQEIYMSEEKHPKWRRLLERILREPWFYTSSILSLAMERYQEISNKGEISIPIPQEQELR